MKRRAQFKVVEFTNATGTTSWRVQGTKLGGERIRSNYTTQAEALGERQRLELEAANVDTATALKSTRLDNRQLQEAEQAFAELGSRSLTAAVRFYLDNYREPLKQKLLSEAFDEFLLSKQRGNRRPHTVRNLRIRVQKLVAKHSGKYVSDILKDHIEEIVFRSDLSKQSQNNTRRALSAFFTWAKAQKYAVDNPIETIPTISVDRKDNVAVLSVEQVRRLLDAASQWKDGKLIPYVALAVFAGLRPTELSRLSWDAIDIKTKEIEIGAAIAKKRQKRTVAMSDNLVAWLLPHVAKRTPIKPVNWQRDFDTIKEAVGFGTKSKEQPDLKPWVQDYLRHTSITFHLAKHQHEGATALWAGNSIDVIHQHYRGSVKEIAKRSQEFWDMTPSETAGKVIKFKAKAA